MRKMERFGRKKKGVSPVIATILMVAITVVLAGVLYVMVLGFTHGGPGTTIAIGFGSPYAATGSSSSLTEVVPITGASNTIYLSSIGFKVTNSAGATQNVTSFIYTSTTGSTIYGFSGGAWQPTGTSTVAVSSGATVTIHGAGVSGSNLAGYTLEVFALSSGVSVSGSVSLD
jgi:flagellin-like protein